MVKKKKYNSDNINDYTKKNFLEVIMTNMYIFDYKIVMYWLPVLLYVNFVWLIITYLQIESQISGSFISFVLVYIFYFIIDLGYQILLCKNQKYHRLITNSLLNSIYPALFVLIGYILSMLLKESKDCVNINRIEDTNNRYTMVNRLYNIHRNNIVVSIFFYIFSIFYNNPINKKNVLIINYVNRKLLNVFYFFFWISYQTS